MSSALASGTIPSEEALLAATIESYVEWREEADATSYAYARWSAAAGHERADAFAVYVAALDREGRASDRYAGALASCVAARLARWFAPGPKRRRPARRSLLRPRRKA